MTGARRLARFVVELKLDAIPEPIVGKAVDLVLDTLGNALAAVHDDFGRAVLAVARDLGGPQESALIGDPTRVAAANAVLANATLAHGLDFDDTREDAIVHTSCVAVTTALAAGEATGASGCAMLEAVIAAVEVMCRIGLAVPGALHARHARTAMGDRRAHPQAVSVRVDRAAIHGLRGAAPTRARRGRRPDRRDPLPYVGRPGAAPVGAARSEARAAQRLRREVQPAVSHRLDPRARQGRPGGVRR